MPQIDLRGILLLVILPIVVIGCSKHIEATEMLSPRGDLVLRIEVDESGGAPVADVTSVFLRLSGSASPLPGRLVFKGSAMGDFRASWQGTDAIALSYAGGFVSTCISDVALERNRRVTVAGCRR